MNDLQRFLPSKGDVFPLFWFVLTLYVIQTAIYVFFGIGVTACVMAWLLVGILVLVEKNVSPGLPQTLRAHLIRWMLSVIWPYYVLTRK